MSVQAKKENPFIKTTVSQDDLKLVEQQSGVSEVNGSKGTEEKAQVNNRQNTPDAGDYAYNRGIVHATDSYAPAGAVTDSEEPDYAKEMLLKQMHIAKRNGGGDLKTNDELNEAASVPPSAFFQPPRRREPFATTKGETASDRFWNDNKRWYNYPDSEKEVKADINTSPKTSSNSNTEDGDGDYKHWDDILNFLDTQKANIKLPSKEEMEKELRRQRTNRIIGGIADASSAIANIIGTSEYAPDAYDPTNNMTDKMKERYDKMKEEWKADEERAYNYAMMAAKIKQDIMDKKHQYARDKIADDYTKAREERERQKLEDDAILADLKAQYYAGKISLQKYQEEEAEIKKKYLPKTYESKIAVNESAVARNNTAATKNTAQAEKARKSGSGKKGSSKKTSGNAGKDKVVETTKRKNSDGSTSTTTRTTYVPKRGGGLKNIQGVSPKNKE